MSRRKPLTKRKRKKAMLRAAGKAPAWLRTYAAAEPGTPKDRSRFKDRGFLKGQKRAPVKHIDPAEYKGGAA